MEKRAVVWFRNDLRLHDNEALVEAIATGAEIVPVYVFDERIFVGRDRFGFEKSSRFRTRFIIQAVEQLREAIRERGADLIVRVGKPEEEVFKIALEVKSSWVFCNRERTREEQQVQDALEKQLWTVGQEIRYTRGKMLYYTADLPFPITQAPEIFTQFRKEVEDVVPVRCPLDTPESIPMSKVVPEPGSIPDLKTFGKEDVFDERHIENHRFHGGEKSGLEQLKYYLQDTGLLHQYFDTRNNMLGWDFSSKLSAWLSAGCISPKMVFHEIKSFEKSFGKSKSTYWLFFELLWRDFFRLMGKKHGDRIFRQSGIKGKSQPFANNQEAFEHWINGTTGVPLIDANMRQLRETGFMSNRGRQIVASFLVNDLQVNWLMGAAYMESMLIDYDPCSHYGNWNYIAGVGSDPREDRYFNPVSQAKKYDPEGDFVRYWIPELQHVPMPYLHQPYLMNDQLQRQYNVILGRDYPYTVTSGAISA
jgi:deoxyribodipyrimidine photo-lyase